MTDPDAKRRLLAYYLTRLERIADEADLLESIGDTGNPHNEREMTLALASVRESGLRIRERIIEMGGAAEALGMDRGRLH